MQTPAAKRVGECRKAAAFRVSEPQSAATEVGLEDTVLFLEVSDDMLLVPLEPAGDHGDEDMQDHRIPQVGSRDMMVCSSILSS